MILYLVTYEPGYRPAGKYKVGKNQELCTRRSLGGRLRSDREVRRKRELGRGRDYPVMLRVQEIDLNDAAWRDTTNYWLGHPAGEG